MNGYAKRLGLAYVYKLTELFYIQDCSPDHQETWRFLDRRITDLRAMKEAKVRSCHSVSTHAPTLALICMLIWAGVLCSHKATTA